MCVLICELWVQTSPQLERHVLSCGFPSTATAGSPMASQRCKQGPHIRRPAVGDWGQVTSLVWALLIHLQWEEVSLKDIELLPQRSGAAGVPLA